MSSDYIEGFHNCILLISIVTEMLFAVVSLTFSVVTSNTNMLFPAH